MKGSEIRKHRESLGLTRNELADKVGVSHSAIYGWETDASSPAEENAAKLAEIFSFGPTSVEAPSPLRKLVGKRMVVCRADQYIVGVAEDESEAYFLGKA